MVLNQGFPFFSQDLPLSALSVIAAEDSSNVTLDILKKYNLVKSTVKFVKIYLSGNITSAVKLVGIRATKGVKSEIEKLGGSVD